MMTSISDKTIHTGMIQWNKKKPNEERIKSKLKRWSSNIFIYDSKKNNKRKNGSAIDFGEVVVIEWRWNEEKNKSTKNDDSNWSDWRNCRFSIDGYFILDQNNILYDNDI